MKNKRDKKTKKDTWLLMLCYSLSNLKNINEAAELLSDLLTPAEIQRISKRLAVATMLIKGDTYDNISKEIQVSHMTIYRIKEWLNNSGKGFSRAHKTLRKFNPVFESITKWEELSHTEQLMRTLVSQHGYKSQNRRTVKQNKNKKDALNVLKHSQASRKNKH